MTVRHFLTTQDFSRSEIDALLEQAAAFKRSPAGRQLAGRSVALLFFNSSMRTRTSFEVGVFELGGHAVILEPGKGAWPIEFEAGTVMDGAAEEHIAEVARVLSRYVDLVGIRAFPKFQDWAEDRKDELIRSFARHSSVPVINMETIVHPCQELAHALAMKEHLGDLAGRKYVLTWAWHPKPLNSAVANSALLMATRMGMDVTLLCPTPEFVLDERYMKIGHDNATAAGGSLTVSHDVEAAYSGAHMVYAKSWGALPYFGRWEQEKKIRDAHRHFTVDGEKMALTDDGLFSHCLPLRRNVQATDEVMEAPYCIAVDEAENRLHTQKALMASLIDPSVLSDCLND